MFFEIFRTIGLCRIENRYTYTDCFESSLLRFVHILFGNRQKTSSTIDNLSINIPKLKEMNTHPYILTFFKKYPIIHPDKTYHIFDYVNSGNSSEPYYHELCSSIKNIVSFFTYFIPYEFEKYHPIQTKITERVDCSIYPKCSGFQTLQTDLIPFENNCYIWVITQFFEKQKFQRITGHSEIFQLVNKMI